MHVCLHQGHFLLEHPDRMADVYPANLLSPHMNSKTSLYTGLTAPKLLMHVCLQQGHFLLEDPDRIAAELALKDEALARNRGVVFAAEERSLPAQQVREGLQGIGTVSSRGTALLCVLCPLGAAHRPHCRACAAP